MRKGGARARKRNEYRAARNRWHPRSEPVPEAIAARWERRVRGQDRYLVVGLKKALDSRGPRAYVVGMSKHSAVTTNEVLDLLASAVNATLRGDEGAASWTFHHGMDDTGRVAFDLFLVRMGDELAYQAGTCESRFLERVRRMVALERNRLAGKALIDGLCGHQGCRRPAGHAMTTGALRAGHGEALTDGHE